MPPASWQDTSRAVAQGEPVPAELIGALRDSRPAVGDGAELRQRLADDGYLFLRGALAEADVRAAHRAVLARLAAVGEIGDPPEQALFTGVSRRRELAGDLGAFWKSVSEEPALRAVSHGDRLRAVMSTFFGEPARPFDFLFLRVGPVGRATALHYDRPFFARGSQRVHTVWFAVGDVAVEEGPLVVLEGSQHFADLLAHAQGIDYSSPASGRVAAAATMIELARERQTRLLTANFAAGDLIVFPMTTMHGSLDNHSPRGRVRVSVDIRYQPAADPIDERYFGPNPGGTTGAGYGELNGAKPLTEPWHVR